MPFIASVLCSKLLTMRYFLAVMTNYLFLILILPSIADTLVINAPFGGLKGDVSPNAAGVYRFLGVPFAETPVRFEKAEQKRLWQGTRDATYYRDSCIQQDLNTKLVFGSEDCLTLDVYTPVNLSNVDVNDPTNQIPVMVWIHGGGFKFGNSSQYEGSKLAHVGDVVVVAIQYRLGAFGWLYSNGVKPSNLGLWDQKLALEWIQRNIHAFGGDNSTVTAFGESAGAISISALAMSPLINSSYFQRVILQSGSTLDGDISQHIRGLSLDGLSVICPRISVQELMNCLQNASALEIAHLSNSEGLLFLPAPDGQFILESSAKTLRDYLTNGISSIKNVIGKFQQYDILNGFNGQEGYLLLNTLQEDLRLNLTKGISNDLYDATLWAEVGSITRNPPGPAVELVGYLQSVYDVQPKNHPSKADFNMYNLLALFGDLMMAIPTINTAAIHSEVVRVTNTQKKTYMYLFDHKPANGSTLTAGPDWLQTSASHGDDLPFIFLLNNRTDHGYLTPEEEKLSHSMMNYWTNFAKTGNPNGKGLQAEGSHKWPEFNKTSKNYVRFTTENVTSEVNPRGDKVDIWSCLYKAVYDDNKELCKPHRP